MKKYSKLGVALAGVLTIAAMSGCSEPEQQPERAEVLSYDVEPAATTEWHKAQELVAATTLPEGSETLTGPIQTGWVPVDDSIVFSLSGAENCFPEIETITREGDLLSIHLKDSPDDCSMTTKVEYFTVKDVTGVERVELREENYSSGFTLARLDAILPEVSPS